MIFLLLSVDSPEKEYIFEANSSIVVGRSSNCDIVLLYKFISRIHCTFVLMREDKKFYYLLFDGQISGKESIPSTFGTWVNRELLIGKYRIKNRDKITFHKEINYPCLVALSDEELDEGGTLAED